MRKNDTALIEWQDLPAAIGLLTRIPLRIDGAWAQHRGAAAAWAYPLAGLVIALGQGGIAWLGLWAGLPPTIVALLLLAFAIIVTGAMHEDGLADTADGFWGGWTPARRLEIMKDSQIGTYGVLALVLAVMLRWGCFSALLGSDIVFAVLIAAAMLSRSAMVTLMTGLPHARVQGLSHAVGRPKVTTAWIAIGLGTVGAVAALGLTAGTLLLVGAALTSLCAGIAHNKIGGQTGDVLGATQQIVEIGLLLTCVSVLTT